MVHLQLQVLFTSCKLVVTIQVTSYKFEVTIPSFFLQLLGFFTIPSFFLQLQSNSVITNSLGPSKFVRYNRGSL
jgi:hypothetical protein